MGAMFPAATSPGGDEEGAVSPGEDEEGAMSPATMSPGEDEDGAMSPAAMSPGKDEDGAMSPDGTRAEEWPLHSPGRSVEEPHDLGRRRFPTLTLRLSPLPSMLRQPVGKRGKKKR